MRVPVEQDGRLWAALGRLPNPKSPLHGVNIVLSTAGSKGLLGTFPGPMVWGVRRRGHILSLDLACLTCLQGACVVLSCVSRHSWVSGSGVPS